MAKQQKGGGEKEAALEELYRHSQSLLRLSRALERAQDYNDVLEAIRPEVQQILGYPTIWVYLFSDDGHYAYPLAADGTASEAIMHDEKAARLTISGDPMLEEITASRDIVVVEDARTDPRTDKEIVTQLGNRTIINVPITFLDKRMGSMGTGTFGDEGIHVPSPTERDYLISVASSLAVTLDRLRLLYEREQAEQALRSEHDHLSSIYATSPVGITVVDRNGKIVEANPQAEKVLGLEREAILQLQYNTAAWKITNLDGSPYPEDQLPFTRVKATGQSVKDVQHAIQRPSGQRVLLSINATPLFDKAGQFDGMIASIEDITQRKEAEKKLLESEQLFRALIENSPDFIARYDLEYRRIYVNPAIQKLFAAPPEEILGETPKKHSPVKTPQAYIDHLQEVIETGAENFLETLFRTAQGEMHWGQIRFTPEFDSNGEVVSILTIGRDINELKEKEQLLLEAQQIAHIGNWWHDMVTGEIYWSDEFFKMLGREPETPSPELVQEIVHPDDLPLLLKEMNESATGKMEHDHNFRIIRPDGEIRWIRNRWRRINDSDGNEIRRVGTHQDITEQKLMEGELRASEQRFRAIFDQSFHLIGLLSSDGTLLEANQTALKLTGVDENKVLGKPFWETPWWTHSTELQQQVRKAVHDAANGKLVRFEANHLDQDGNIHYVDFSLKPVIDTDGKVIQLIPEGRDITEQKHAATALAASERQFRSLAENSPDNIVRYDSRCRLIYYNPAMAKTLPHEIEKFLGKTPTEVGFGGPEVSAEYEANIRHVLKSGESSDMELVVPDIKGQPRNNFVRFAPELNEQGEVTAVIAIGRDITEIKQAEEKILQSEQQLRLHAEQSPLGFLVWDENFCASEWNAACEKIFGYTREEALGRHAKDLILPAQVHELVDGIYRDLMNQTGGTHSTNENTTKDGRTIIVEWFNTTLKNKDGKAVGVASICRDITELKQAEQERQLYAEFLTCMDRINRAIQGADNLETMMRDVLDEVLDIFNCDRSFLMYPCDPIAEFWGVPMERTRPEYPGAGITGEDIPMDADVATTLELLLSSDGAVKFGPETEHPLPKEVSERYGFKSFMSIALYPKIGNAWQFGIHQCSHARVWTEAEKHLLEEIGRRLSDGLSSLLTLRDLRKSEARYQRLFDTANEGIWIQDENFVTTFVNEHMANMLGYSVEELQGKKVTDFMTDEDAADHVRKMEERSRNISDIYERRMHHKDGSDVWMLISATPVFENDRFHGSFAMLTDITARKNAEIQLASNEQLFRTLIEHSPDYIVRYDKDLQRIYINPALQEQFAVPVEQALGHPPTETSPLIDPERYMAHIRQAMETGTECSDEHAYRKPDGEIRWASSRFIPEFDLDGKVATVMVVSTDVTERKRAEEELVLSEEKFSKAFYASPNLMAITRPKDGLIVDINESFCHFFGYTRDECIGHSTAELQMWVNPEQRDKVVQMLKETGSVLYEPVDLRTKSGEIRSVIDSLVFINIDKQEYLLSVATDVTERKQAEEALRIHKQHLEEIVEQRTTELRLARDAAEAANKAKSVFLANMSHELRTPLNAILGFSQMMQQNPDLNTKQHETLDIINNSGEHLLKLINDVLEIAKIEAGKLQLDIATFDLHSLVREVSDMMRLRAEQKGLQLELDQSSDFPRYIKADEARLRQILVNLISNAVKFTDEGKVTIRLTIKNNARHHLVIEIEDTGPGISKEDQQRLFKPFVQLSEGKTHIGSGLGLSIVHQFVQLMKGNISVESTPGEGSLFRVELPLDEAKQMDIDRLSDEQHGEVTGLVPGQPVYRILVTEDQHDNQLLLAKLMTDIGMEVKTADNGKVCVEIFKKWKPDLIWMDHRMPVMDGIEATKRIRKMRGGKKVKIVAVTASAFKEQQNELLDAGMDGFIRKPYQFSEIYNSMAQQLGIEFTYSEETPIEPSLNVLTPERLRVLPADILNELRHAAESLNRERINTTINQITELDRNLGRTLSHMADEFDYPSILDALNAVAEESHTP